MNLLFLMNSPDLFYQDYSVLGSTVFGEAYKNIEPVRTVTFARLSDSVLKDEYASLKSTKEGLEFFPLEDSKKQEDALYDVSLKIEFCTKELQRRGLKYE
ncbi:MAG: hypothetical protein ACLFQJ_10080 [Campylobacterales bacterium]